VGVGKQQNRKAKAREATLPGLFSIGKRHNRGEKFLQGTETEKVGRRSENDRQSICGALR
jgi:hypothetical protein